MSTGQSIDLTSPLRLSTAFRFPLQSRISREEVYIGALWLFVPFVGWILNMGHRIMMTHRMQHGMSAWPAWSNHAALFRHGFIAFLGMVQYPCLQFYASLQPMSGTLDGCIGLPRCCGSQQQLRFPDICRTTVSV
jgi:hypothetical protein